MNTCSAVLSHFQIVNCARAYELSWVMGKCGRPIARWAVNCCSCLTKISSFRGLVKSYKLKGNSATENENIMNRKIDEQHKFSLARLVLTSY